MAANLRLSNTAANAGTDAICANCNSGYLRIYDGSQPATANTAITTQTLIAELRFSATAFGAASLGVATANAITSGTASAAGTATWFRTFKSDGTTAVFDGTVGTATANLVVSAVAIALGESVGCSSLTYTLPKASSISPTYGSEVTAWYAAVVAAGGTANEQTLDGLDAFVTAAKAKGYWSQLLRFNPFLGDQLAAALIPLKAGGGNATETNVGPFVAGDYTLAGGLTGDGSTKWLRTGWIPSTELVTTLDAHFGLFVLTAPTSANRNFIGSLTSGNNFFSQYRTTGTQYFQNLGRDIANITPTFANPPAGHLVTSVTASATGAFYQNAAANGTIPNATTNNRSPVECYVFDINNNGAHIGACPMRLGGYHFGLGLTAQNVSDLYSDLLTLHTAVGRA